LGAFPHPGAPAQPGGAPIQPSALGTEELPLTIAALQTETAQWRDRVLAADVIAPATLPPFDNSQMDGYAVRSADLARATAEQPVTLRVRPAIVAGETGGALGVGEAAPIMTGAPIPAGADAVVPVEDVDPPRFIDDPVDDPADHPLVQAVDQRRNRDHPRIRVAAPVAPGTFVRATGTDVRRGELLLPAGARLTPAALGVLASSGLPSVTVRRRPVVLLTVTGNEVRQPGTPLRPGQIHDANSFSLWSALVEAGTDVIVAPCESDESADLRAVLGDHAAGADLVLTVGGVSAGSREVVRDVFEPLGVWFGAVAMQPGGPQGLGLARIRDRDLPVVCFPGNPVSCLVSFEVFLRPLLRALATGQPAADVERPRERRPLAEALSSPRGKHQVRRGIVDADGRVRPVGGPSSHLLHAYARSTVLIHVPTETDRLEPGDEVEIWRIDG
ncbi:gephyrin-like molybdotransferase Glp, partial [Microbacterium sp.]|uniref:molybdopterin molybdotransferase MoeA n=1 Tax=Microbacterium sp. TaxID=51671 RepID=UPI003C738A63